MDEIAARARLANLGTRFLALLIDSIVLGLIGGLLFRFARQPGGVLGLLLGAAYQWYFLTQHRGQTLGKLLLGIRVVKTDGSPITAAEAIMRYFGYVLNSMLLGIGWLWAFFDPRRQGLHDKLANTMVVEG